MKNEGFLLTDQGIFQLVTTDLPDILPSNSVLLQIQYCGICGGDYSCYIGRRPGYPKSLGHEFVGKVLSAGDCKALAVGEYVVSDLNYRCGKCDYCITGQSHLCIENNTERFSNRAFFKYMVVDEAYLFKVDIPIATLYRATLIEPLSCVIHACSQIAYTAHKSILINGCGSIGTLACFYLKNVLGYNNISVYDTNTNRSKALSNLMQVNRSIKLLDDSFDLVFECTNSPMGMKNSLRSIKQGRELCVLSHIYGECTSFVYEMMCKKELHPVFPLRNGETKNIFTAIDIIKHFWINSFDSLIGIYGFSELPEVFCNKEHLPFNKQVIKVAAF